MHESQALPDQNIVGRLVNVLCSDLPGKANLLAKDSEVGPLALQPRPITTEKNVTAAEIDLMWLCPYPNQIIELAHATMAAVAIGSRPAGCRGGGNTNAAERGVDAARRG